MNDTPTVWELIGAGVAIGGTAVWALAAAARVGVLRAFLDLLPRASWDAVTWVLIPALLLAPIVIQGIAVAAFGGRASTAWVWGAAGAAAGSLAALAVFGAALLMGVRQLPRDGQVWLGRTAPEALIIGFSAAVLAGWLIVASRLVSRLSQDIPVWRFGFIVAGSGADGRTSCRPLRGLPRVPWPWWAAVPVAAFVVAVAWIRAHHTVVAVSYVLDRPEANGFFAAVAVGGAVGSAWAARRGASDGH